MPAPRLAAGLAAAAFGFLSSAMALDYPPAPRGSVVDDYHGQRVADPYRWLEDLDAPQTRAWVEAQNALSLPLLAALPQREAFRARLTGLWNYERWDVPRKAAGQYFFTRNDGLQNQSVLYVQSRRQALPRVLLDPNLLSADGTVALTQFEPSPDGRWLAYATASAGSDWNALRIRSVDTGKDSPETLLRVKFSDMQWTRDSRGFFYSRYPDPPPGLADSASNRAVFDGLEHQKIYYHRVGSAQKDDVLVFEMPAQPKWFVGGELTPDGRYLFIALRQGSADECRLLVLDLVDPQNPQLGGKPLELVGNFDHSYEIAGSRGDEVFLLTNHGAPRKRVVAVKLHQPQPEHWREVVPESEDRIDTALIAGGRLVVLALHDAASRLRRYTLDGKALPELKLPGLGSVPSLPSGGYALHGEADDAELLLGYTSYSTPLTPYRLDVASGKLEAFHRLQLSFEPSDYITEQVFYSSKDGTRVPMFISHKKGLERDGKARAFLHGYGGFDISKTPSFDVSALAWMEQGGVYAVANLRGGGEYGEQWHLAGTRERKQNVFDDFVAAAGYLVAQRYTDYPRIAIWGRSNGGLLVGASVNQQPQLWGAAVATVGVMDMLRFHKFTVGYAWTGDYGSSDDAAGFAWLSKYSPLHTVKPGTHYPPTLVTTGDHDDRVHPAHSYKYTAQLQAAQGGEAPVLIRIDTRAGHGAGKPVAKVIEEEADKLAFMWHYTAGTTGPR